MTQSQQNRKNKFAQKQAPIKGSDVDTTDYWAQLGVRPDTCWLECSDRYPHLRLTMSHFAQLMMAANITFVDWVLQGSGQTLPEVDPQRLKDFGRFSTLGEWMNANLVSGVFMVRDGRAVYQNYSTYREVVAVRMAQMLLIWWMDTAPTPQIAEQLAQSEGELMRAVEVVTAKLFAAIDPHTPEFAWEFGTEILANRVTAARIASQGQIDWHNYQYDFRLTN